MKTENFDEYMKELGVGLMLRKIAGQLKPSQVFSIEGDTWTLKTLSTFKNTEIKFKLGEEFDESTADGREVKTTCTLEGDNKLIQDQKGEKNTTLTREIIDDKMLVMTLDVNGVICTRTYNKEE